MITASDRAKALICAASHWEKEEARCELCRDDHAVWEIYAAACDWSGPWQFGFAVAASMALSEVAAFGFDVGDLS